MTIKTYQEAKDLVRVNAMRYGKEFFKELLPEYLQDNITKVLMAIFRDNSYSTVGTMTISSEDDVQAIQYLSDQGLVTLNQVFYTRTNGNDFATLPDVQIKGTFKLIKWYEDKDTTEIKQFIKYRKNNQPLTQAPRKLTNINHSVFPIYKQSNFCKNRRNNVNQQVNLAVLNLLNNTKLVINHDMDSYLPKFIKLDHYYLEDDLEEYKDREFYIFHKLDARGRIYCGTYNLNYQGDNLKKSLITLANKEVVDEEGLENLYIDLANNLGLDKMDYEDRIDLAKKFRARELPLEHFNVEQDEMPKLVGSMSAIKQAINGNPIGWVTQFDATASGVAINALLSGEEDLIHATNLMSDPHRQDAYTYIFNQFKAECGVYQNITRNDLKQVIMCMGYGSKAKPKEILGPELAKKFKGWVKKRFPKWQTLLECYKESANECGKDTWLAPDGFEVVIPKGEDQRYTFYLTNHLGNEIKSELFIWTDKSNKDYTNDRPMLANVTHSLDSYLVRELIARCVTPRKVLKQLRNKIKNQEEEKYTATGYISKRSVAYYLNEDLKGTLQVSKSDKEIILPILEELLEELRFDILPVHDSFGCHPNYVNQMRTTYNKILCTLNHKEALNQVLNSIGYKGDKYPFTPGEVNNETIINSKYSLC